MAEKYIKIVGGAVHVVSERVEKTVRLEDFLAEAAKDAGVLSPVLPLGCRLFRQKDDRTVFVIEQAPQVRRLSWHRMAEGSEWKLAFPYIIFVVVFRGESVLTDQCRIFYRNAPLTSAADPLMRVNLCNVYLRGAICTGSMRVEGEGLAQKAESFCQNFWRSQFNSDLQDECFYPAANSIPEVANLDRWQEESAKNPLFPLATKWLPAGKLSDYLGGE